MFPKLVDNYVRVWILRERDIKAFIFVKELKICFKVICFFLYEVFVFVRLSEMKGSRHCLGLSLLWAWGLPGSEQLHYQLQ